MAQEPLLRWYSYPLFVAGGVALVTGFTTIAKVLSGVAVLDVAGRQYSPEYRAWALKALPPRS